MSKKKLRNGYKQLLKAGRWTGHLSTEPVSPISCLAGPGLKNAML